MQKVRLASYYYDAFGNILESTGNMDNPYRYAGYQYDKETDTYYCMARMYDPYIARFLSEDTYTGDVNDPLSLNLYTYCVNNPITYYDPTGHIIDTIADVGFIIWDIVDIAKDTKDWKNWAALGADVICEIVPFATGGGRAIKAVDKAVDVYQAIDKTKDTYKAVNKTKEVIKATRKLSKKVIKNAAVEGAIYSLANEVHQVVTTGEVDVKGVVNAGIEGASRRAVGEVVGLGVGKGLEVGTRKFTNSSAGKKVINKVGDFVNKVNESKFAKSARKHYDNVLYHAKNFIANENGHIKLPDGSGLKVRNVGIGGGVNTELPGRNGALNQAKRDANVLRNQKPDYIEKVKMTEAESRGGHVIKDANGKMIETREYHYTNRFGEELVIQEHSYQHIGSEGPHFNVRPITDTRNGVFPGTKEHYPFKK